MHDVHSVASLLPRASRGGAKRRASADIVPLHPIPSNRRQGGRTGIVRDAGSGRTERSAAPPRDVLVTLVRSYVLAHIGRPITLAEIVSVAGVSETTLRRAVQAEAGVHLVQYMINTRLDRAHALLSTNRESRSVSQLANALGFSSTAFFSRAYRKRYGEAVSETRRRAVNRYDPTTDASKYIPSDL